MRSSEAPVTRVGSVALTRPRALWAWVSTLALGAFLGCTPPQARLQDDTAQSRVTPELLERWRSEVAAFEARRIRGVDAGTYDRVRGWVDRLEAGHEVEKAPLLVLAIQGELEVLHTAELRFGAGGAVPAQPAEEAP